MSVRYRKYLEIAQGYLYIAISSLDLVHRVENI